MNSDAHRLDTEKHNQHIKRLRRAFIAGGVDGAALIPMFSPPLTHLL